MSGEVAEVKQRPTKKTRLEKNASFAPGEGNTIRAPADKAQRPSKVREIPSNDDKDGCRAKVRRLLESTVVDCILSLVIVSNVGLMVAETNYTAFCDLDLNSSDASCQKGSAQDTSLFIANMSYQGFYTLEVIIRVFVYGCSFCKSSWNLLDFTIVTLGYVDLALVQLFSGTQLPGPGVAILRIFRIARLLRIVRILSFFPELYIMIRGFMGAMKAMFWGMFMIACLLLIWAILGVELINPVSRELSGDGYEACRIGFSQVERTMLIFFQTVFAGDSWGACALPIITQQPALFIIFAGTLITIQLGFTNLVLAVIVERATKATEKDAEERIKERKAWHAQATAELWRLIRGIDRDESGSITLDELLQGYKEVPELNRIFGLIDIDENHLEEMFELLADEQGHASYEHLVESLERCESEDLRRQTMIMGLQLNRIRQNVCPPKKHALAELEDVHKEARKHFEESLQILGENLDEQWSLLQRKFQKHMKEQAATLSRHTQMLSQISAAATVGAEDATKAADSTDVAAPSPAPPPSPPPATVADSVRARLEMKMAQQGGGSLFGPGIPQAAPEQDSFKVVVDVAPPAKKKKQSKHSQKKEDDSSGRQQGPGPKEKGGPKAPPPGGQ